MGAKTLSSSSNVAFGVDGQLTDRALSALLKHHESSSSDNNNLLGSDLDVQVQFSLARIPGNASPKPIRIEIPHPLVKVASPDNDAAAAAEEEDGGDYLQDVDACIIVKEESKPWVQDLIGRFPAQLGCIKKVLGLQSLRTKHKSFTQRRELLGRFNLFFADDRILPMLTKALGGKFFEKKKQPVPVKLTRKDALPFAIQKCLSSTYMYLSAGTCVTVKAGNTAMPPAKLLSNIQSICSIVPTKVPRKWSNIRSISIKTSSSVALPIYNKTPEKLEVIMKLAKERKGSEEKGEEAEEEHKGKRKRKMAAANSDLAEALKKQKAAEHYEKAEKDSDEVVEKPTKTSKKKREESMNETEIERAIKPTKFSKKTRKESIESSCGLDVAQTIALAKTPKKKKKKKGKNSIDENKEEGEVKKKANTPKLLKKLESKAESSTTTSSKKTPKKTSDESSSKEDKKFISSKQFSGAKEGYVFSKGNLGNGYYEDVPPVVEKNWLSSLSRKAGRGGGGGSRKSMGYGMKKKKSGRSSRRSY